VLEIEDLMRSMRMVSEHGSIEISERNLIRDVEEIAARETNNIDLGTVRFHGHSPEEDHGHRRFRSRGGCGVVRKSAV
jgi:hypothetical protein